MRHCGDGYELRCHGKKITGDSRIPLTLKCIANHSGKITPYRYQSHFFY